MKLEVPSLVSRIVGGVVTLLIAFFLNWLFLPAWNIRSGGLWWYLFLVFLIGLGIFSIVEGLDNTYVMTLIFTVICILIAILGIIFSLSSSVLFNAKRYARLISIEEGNFEGDIQKISSTEEANEFPLLDVQTAEKLGNRSLSEVERVSQYQVNSEYNLISYNDEAYRLSPLEYAGFFMKAINNESIPGYVLVNSETQECEFVNLEEPIIYAPSDIFSQDLKRHLREEYPSYIFGKAQFDINDAGKAYYIVPVMKSTIGMFGGRIVKSFILLDAYSGDMTEYEPDELPEWVDHAYSLDYLMGLAKYYYSCQDGFLNSIFSQTNVKLLSYSYRGDNVNEDDDDDENVFEGYNSILTSDGVQFFTCVVSANNDESALGFILANAKTGRITFYECSGAEEGTAQLQAESLYQNFGYKSSYPLMVNVNGEPTYVVSLKDKSKINKAYVLVNVSNYTISGKGESLAEALNDYKQNVFGTTEEVQQEEKEEELEIKYQQINNVTGTITQLYQVIQDGETQFFFILDGSDTLFISPISNNSRQVLLKVGNQVSLEYYMSSNEENVGMVSKIKF